MIVSEECSPKRIIQIVSGSRSGSSLLKRLLSQSPDIVSLDGEEEPYFSLSGNGYGKTSASDMLLGMSNPSLFRRLIQTELVTQSPWAWRLGLQYRGSTLATLLDRLDRLDPNNPIPWLKLNGIWGHYDGCLPCDRLPFKEMAYEMGPFVIPRSDRKELPKDYTLLLKSPYNVYRQGLLESIFPDAEFEYILLLRNPAATINGLIDGWRANYGFYKHLTPYGWWKFDLPPRWRDYVTKPIEEKAWLQWSSSYSLIADRVGIHCRFEDLITSPSSTVGSLCDQLDIQDPNIKQLPLVMATEQPKPYRWLHKAAIIEPLLTRSETLIHRLGYTDRTLWI